MEATASDNWAEEFSPDEIRSVWNGKLRPIADDVIARQISAPTREFLVRIGLPNDPDLPDASFADNSRLSKIVHHAGMDLVMITDDDSPTAFGIDVVSDRVYAVRLSNARYTRFFNSSVAATVYFLGMLNRDILTLPEADELTLTRAIDGIWDALMARDPRAMEGPSPWKAWLDALGGQYE